MGPEPRAFVGADALRPRTRGGFGPEGGRKAHFPRGAGNGAPPGGPVGLAAPEASGELLVVSSIQFERRASET